MVRQVKECSEKRSRTKPYPLPIRVEAAIAVMLMGVMDYSEIASADSQRGQGDRSGGRSADQNTRQQRSSIWEAISPRATALLSQMQAQDQCRSLRGLRKSVNRALPKKSIAEIGSS